MSIAAKRGGAAPAGHRLADLPLYLKGLIVVAIPMAALVVVSVSLYFLQKQNRDAERWVRQTLQVATQIQMVRTLLEETETGISGYLLTRNPDWLDAYREARRRLPERIAELESMVADAEQQQRLRRIKSSAARLLAALGESPGAAALPAAAVAQSKTTIDELRRGLQQMRFEQDRLLNERISEANRARERSQAMAAAGLVLAPLGGVLAMLLFTAGLARRIERLEDNAWRLSRGERLSPMVSGQDEIGRLELSLGEAASLLAARERELRKARDELEQRVAERTAALARVNRALEAEIAERKRAEEHQRQAHETLRAVIDATPLAIIGLDLNGSVRSWNRAAEELFGWTQEEVLGRPLPTVPDQERDDFQALLQATARGESLTGLERRRRRKNGSLVDVQIWTSPLRDLSGAITAKIAVMADFTDRKRLEEQFLQAQKMEAVGRLAGGVAHDFNNLLTVISGYAHMLLSGLEHDESLRACAEEVLRAAERAAGLTNQLLSFSRRQALEPRIVDLNGLLSNMERMLRRVIGEDIELKTELRPGVWAVKVDPGRIEQVVMNLVVNARDAMPQGGKLTIETSNVEVNLAAEPSPPGPSGEQVMLAVSDTGEGMSAETKSHLFEPFFTTKEKGKGTGLGLSTVYGIVRQHGGEIWVYSEPGEGTIFKIYLPRADCSAVQPRDSSVRRDWYHGNETILLVEDEEGVRRLVREVLELRGYRVLEAAGGRMALELARAHPGPIELLLTDVVMPVLGGREVAEAVQKVRPETRVLFLSGYTEHVMVDHGVLPAGIDFLEKPFTPDVLAQKVRAVLDAPEHGRGAS